MRLMVQPRILNLTYSNTSCRGLSIGTKGLVPYTFLFGHMAKVNKTVLSYTQSPKMWTSAAQTPKSV